MLLLHNAEQAEGAAAVRRKVEAHGALYKIRASRQRGDGKADKILGGVAKWERGPKSAGTAILELM